MTGLFAFLQFCLLSSLIYIINDINDLEKDRLHPLKKARPLASGEITTGTAKVIAFILLILIILLQATSNYKSKICWLTLATYFTLNVLYSVKGLKNFALFDVYILAFGFVLRIMYGSFCTKIEISSWLYVVVFFGALFMGFGKRRNELKQIGGGVNTREVLLKYNMDYLSKCLYSCMTLSIVFYSFWCLEKDSIGNSRIYIVTIPIFAFILFKYSLDIETDKDGDPTNIILGDIGLIVLCLILLIFLGFAIFTE